ncbi:hypothetical protein [Mechercharimyces sp. CAU 1602]|nr:hypothetical protein [Mechercharimyces sp. CAU 1602]MCS1350378.1 hypothetical protein [Mechercharimyces sp. CAU 1602]
MSFYPWLRRIRSALSFEKGASTLEYVVILAAGVLLATILVAVMALDQNH